MRSITSADVLNDIEFELIQGAVSHDDLGQGIQTARQYQNKMRAEMLDAATDGDMDTADLVGRQFQLNDMLLTLLQVANERVQTLQVKLHKSAYIKQHRPAANDAAVGASSDDGSASDFDVDDFDLAWTPDFVSSGPVDDEDLADAMSSDALAISMDVRPVNMPLVGGFLTRIRTALHSLVHFYVERLATKQADVNQVYGEHIARVEQINRQQQNQIEALGREIEVLQARRDL